MIPPGADVLHPVTIRHAQTQITEDDFVNQRDRVAKGVQRRSRRNQRGEENKMAKLSEKEVLKIRKSMRRGVYRKEPLACPMA